MDSAPELLEQCSFPAAGTTVSLAVSGGPDSMGLTLLALAHGLAVTLHHVDHHARATSANDAALVERFATQRGVALVRHDVEVGPGPNFESRARAARRRVLPAGTLTGHTMDDLAETIVINLLRGAGMDGLSPLVGDPTKPLLGLRRAELHRYVDQCGVEVARDETNDDPQYLRNRVRHELLPLMNDLAARDVVPLLARQALLLGDERNWLEQLVNADLPGGLAQVSCREIRKWPRARQRRWLRQYLRSPDEGDGEHPPSADEVERALHVVSGDVVATELSGGRRLSRSGQYLALSKD